MKMLNKQNDPLQSKHTEIVIVLVILRDFETENADLTAMTLTPCLSS